MGNSKCYYIFRLRKENKNDKRVRKIRFNYRNN